MPFDEEEIRTLEESPISFGLTRPNERPSRNDHSDDEPVSNGNSVVQSQRQKPRRWLTRKEKAKMKMSEYRIEASALVRSDSDTAKSEDGPQEVMSESA